MVSARALFFFTLTASERLTMATVINVSKSVERIYIPDEENPEITWTVRTDDKSIEELLGKVGNAIETIKPLMDAVNDSESDEERDENVRAVSEYMKRMISAIVGADGYQELLAYIGDGEPCDPENHLNDIGEVFAALCTWLYQRCTARQLRKFNIMIEDDRRIIDYKPPKKKRPKKRK